MKRAWVAIVIASVIVTVLLLPAPRFTLHASRSTEPQAGVDLTAEISLNPTIPDVGQPSTIRVVVRNRGTSSATTGFYVYLYVDPTSQPDRKSVV